MTDLDDTTRRARLRDEQCRHAPEGEQRGNAHITRRFVLLTLEDY